MNLEARTQMSEQIFRDHLWFNFLRHRRYRTLIPILFAIYVVLGGSALVLGLLDDNAMLLLLSGLLFLCVLLVFGFLLVWPKRQYEAARKRFGAPQRYVFSDDGFTAQIDAPLYQGESFNRYEILVKACETDDYFFLYIMPNQAFVVRKNDFTSGEPEALREKLREKLGRKYREYRR